MLYHIVPAAEFRTRITGAAYRPANLAHDGFVHCALRGSVLLVADDYYSRVSGQLLLLEIDPERLASETRYEAPAPIAGGGTSHLASASEFPHVYGPIETGAITRVGVLVPSASGFQWPTVFMGLEAFLSDSGPRLSGDPSERVQPRQLVRSWVEAFNRADAEALADFYADDAINDQVAEAPVHGRAAIHQMFVSEFASATMECIVENIFAEGEWAILEWRDPLGLRGCGFFRVVGGKIVLQRGYWDKLTFLRVHGLPIPKER